MRSVAEHKAFLQSLASKVSNSQAGFFGPESVAWRLNGEVVLGLVVLRALFLQVAHPKVAQGVADHSDFRRKPFERALATFKAQQHIVFGTCDESIDALMRIYARHVGVRGGGYEANGPALLFWVYATLIDSMFFAYRTFLPDLSAADWARFYEEGKLFAKLIGISDGEVPARLSDFEAWMTAKLASNEIAVSPAGYEVGQSLLRIPIAAAKPLTSFVAAGTLPPKLREQFGLRWTPRKQWLFDRLAAAVRFGARLLPAALHTSPAYWLALRRVRASR